MKTLIMLSLVLLMMISTSTSYAVTDNIDTTQSESVNSEFNAIETLGDRIGTTQSERVCGPGPIGKALSAFLKPYIKQAVQQLVKRSIVSKTAGKKICKTLIGCTTVTGLCQLAKQQLDVETCIGIAKSSLQYGYEELVQSREISTQVKSNMQDFLQKYKEEHTTE